MTAAEMMKNLNHTAFANVEGFKIKVQINDVRQVFGRVDYLVIPIEGEGQQWMSEDRITVLSPTNETLVP